MPSPQNRSAFDYRCRLKMISKMEFECKLAHSDKTRTISGFNSIKALYEQISKAFSVPSQEILFCTLNTHDFRNMDQLLGNYLSLGDLIVVHMCGNVKDLNIRKTEEYLGLTITDNGNGRAFVKKVKSNDSQIEEMIQPGDHIAAIDSDSMVGLRHYEVARAIREVPQRTNFTLHLIEPLHSDRYLDLESLLSDGAAASSKNSRSESQTSNAAASINLNQGYSPDLNGSSPFESLINSSLPIDKLLAKSCRVVSQDDANQASTIAADDSYRSTINKINTILESFLGINDNSLAIQIYRIAKENGDSFDSFAKAVRESELNAFKFNQDLTNYLWTSATSHSTS